MPAFQKRRAISLIEMLIAFAILVLTLVPLLELMTTTTKGTRLTRDYLIGYNLAQLVFENVMHAATVNPTDAFDKVLQAKFITASPAPVTKLAEGETDGLLPTDGKPEFDPASGDPDYVALYKRYTYTCTITQAPASADTVVANGHATLMRVDIEVFWNDGQNHTSSVKFSDYVARRQF